MSKLRIYPSVSAQERLVDFEIYFEYFYPLYFLVVYICIITSRLRRALLCVMQMPLRRFGCDGNFIDILYPRISYLGAGLFIFDIFWMKAYSRGGTYSKRVLLKSDTCQKNSLSKLRFSIVLNEQYTYIFVYVYLYMYICIFIYM